MPDVLTRLITTDVVIVGGGVTGLWLLNDLRREGYSAVLLERRELGGGQTCHSHVYIHQGHIYHEKDRVLAASIAEVKPLWDAWFDAQSPQRVGTPSYFGFSNPAEARIREALWRSLGLACRDIPVPEVLAGGAISRAFESPEVSIDGEALVRALRGDVDHFISRVAEVERVEVDRDARTVEGLLVEMPGGLKARFEAQAVVFAAGNGNYGLCAKLAADAPDTSLIEQIRQARQTRKAHMLVIRGPKAALMPLTGVFPDLQGLFIVARELPDEVVWLVSDYNSQKVESVEDWIAYDAREWLPGVLGALRLIAPAALSQPDALKWGVYEAPKAEGTSGGLTGLPHEEHVRSFGFNNLRVVWPTKLTLAPRASRRIIDELRGDGILLQPGEPLAPAWQECRAPAEIATELWRKTPLAAWHEFCHFHNL